MLDNQRGVVQNEKRQGDSRPGGLVQYQIFGNLFPEAIPTCHGDRLDGDLDAASLADVKQWFRDKYGPNNAFWWSPGTTLDQVRTLTDKYFRPIPAANHPAQASVPTLAAPKSIAMKDHVATTIIQRYWTVPGLLDRRLAALDIGGSVLGRLNSSRLDKIMVRNEDRGRGERADVWVQRVSIFNVSAYVKPGVDPALVSKRLDEIMADYIAKGPTEDEVGRAVMSEVSGRIRGLEQVGGFGKAVSSPRVRRSRVTATSTEDAELHASITPAVRAAMQQWLRRPALTITLSPGERDAYTESKSVDAAAKPESKSDGVVKGDRPIPPVGQLAALDFPAIVHSKLSNGIAVQYVQRTTVPVTQIAMAFDAGLAADSPQARGLADMTMGLLDEGTSQLSSQEVAETEERLGADVSSSNAGDRSYVMLNSLSNLAPSLA